MSNQIEIAVIFEADVSDAERAKKAATDLSRTVDKVTSANKKLAASGRDATGPLERGARAAKSLGDNAASSARRAQSEVQELSAEYRSLQDRIEAAKNAAGERFDVTRRNVELAGDFGTAAATVGSVTGIEGIGAAGELVELAEALPLLKQAAIGLPATIGNAAAALGPVGLAAGAALAVVALAIQDFVSGLQEAQSRLSGAIEARNQVLNDIAAAIPVEQAQERVRQLEVQLSASEERIRLNQEAITNAFEQAQEQFGDFGARILQALGLLPTKQLEEDLNAAKKAAEEASTGINLYTDAIEDNKFTASEAADTVADTTTQTNRAIEQAQRSAQRATEQRTRIEDSYYSDSASRLKDALAQETALKTQASQQQVAAAQRVAQAASQALVPVLGQSRGARSAEASGSFIRRLNPNFNLSAFTGVPNRTNNNNVTVNVNGSQNPETVARLVQQQMATVLGRA